MSEIDEIPEDMTELYDAQVPRIDLVGKGANGMPFLIAKQDADASVGLFDPAYVRELISKAEAGEPAATHPQEMVTVTASPAAMAALIHGASVRKSENAEADLEKAEASTRSMNDRPDSDFAYVESGGKKDDEGKTVPRSLRHFPIYDAAHVRNALSRAPQSPFGDKAMPKIRAAAKRFGIDVAKDAVATTQDAEVTKDMEMPMDDEDSMDPCVALAEPDEQAPGDPGDPGSPAWEAIDAATARKWTAIAARLRAALGVMADRENLEAATVDPDDAEAAMDLDDAACAIDYVISVLAPFAVDEQAEADDGAMEMLGKSIGALDVAHLDTVESLGALRKAGRTLSAVNETALRQAISALQQILASLPAAPVTKKGAGQPVAKTANEEPNMPETTPASETTSASGQEPAMGTASPEPKPVAGAAVTEVAKSSAPSVEEIVTKLAAAVAPQPTGPVAAQVAKAEKTPQVAIYDAHGNLVGTVDPAEITTLAPAKAPEAGAGQPQEPKAEEPAESAAAPADLTPAPAAEVGIPADGEMTKSSAAEAAGRTTETVLKGSDITALVKSVLDEYSAGQAELVKSLQDQNVALEERNTELTKQAAEFAQRIERLENAPAVMAIARHGAVPPREMLRGHDRGGVDLTEGQALRKQLGRSDDAQEQQSIATQLNMLAIDKLKDMHAGRRG